MLPSGEEIAPSCTRSFQRNPRHAPSRADRRPPEPRGKSRHHHDDSFSFGGPRVGDGTGREVARGIERLIGAGGKERRVCAPESQQFASDEQLDPAVLPVAEQICSGRWCGERGELVLALFVIDRAAIIRIDQTEIPEFRPLINIRHARDRQFEHQIFEDFGNASAGETPFRAGAPHGLRLRILRPLLPCGMKLLAVRSAKQFARRVEPLESRIAPAAAFSPGAVELSQLDEGSGTHLLDSTGTFISELGGPAGDFNADGLEDFVVAWWDGTAGPQNTGSNGDVYVVFGRPDGFSAEFDVSSLNGTNGFHIRGETQGDDLGSSIAGIGDFNGDQIDDLAIGAEFAGPAAFSEPGSIYVIFGRPGPFEAEFDLASLDGTNGFRFDGPFDRVGLGRGLSSAGDFNADGFKDFLASTDRGLAYLVFGTDATLPPVLAVSDLNVANGFTITGEEFDFFFPGSIGGGGDFNGDGFDDVILGAPDTIISNQRTGAAYILYGSAAAQPSTVDVTALPSEARFRMGGSNPGDLAGLAVSFAGDINNDGFADAIIAAPVADECYVVFGRSSNERPNLRPSQLNGLNGFRIEQTGFVRTVWAAGDVNGDGFGDIIIPANAVNRSEFDPQTSAMVLFGKADGYAPARSLASFTALERLRVDGLESGGSFSPIQLNTAGDVNSDGFDDLIATGRRDGAYLIFGSPAVELNPSKLVFSDSDGDKVVVQLAAGELSRGDLKFALHNDLVLLEKVNLTGKSDLAAGVLSISVKKATTGDGLVNVGEIDAQGLNLERVKIIGDLTSLKAGAGAGAENGIDKIKAVSFGAARTSFPNIVPEVDVSGSIDKLVIARGVSGMTAVSAGNFGQIRIGADLTETTFHGVGATDPIGFAFGIVEIGGDMRNSSFLGGYDVAGTAVNGDATIGRIVVRGTFEASNIVAGMADISEDGFGRNDTVIPGSNETILSRIATVVLGSVLGTTAAGDHFGITAEQIDKAKIGGARLPMTDGKDVFLVAPGQGDVRVAEV